jgi:hypothetical protein
MASLHGAGRRRTSSARYIGNTGDLQEPWRESSSAICPHRSGLTENVMTRIRKLLLAVLALICLLVAVVVVAIRFVPETDIIRHNIEERLHASTGRPVSLGGLKVSVSFPKLINICIEGISVPSEDGKSFIAADRVLLTPSLTSLVKREISIESLTIEGLRATVRRSKIKSDSADGLRESGKVPGQGDSGSPAAPPVQHGEAGVPAPSAPQAASHAMKWSVNSVRVTKSRLEWIDQVAVPGKEVMLVLKDIEASLNQRESGTAFSVRLTGILSGDAGRESPTTIEGSVQIDAARPDLESMEFTLRCPSLDFTSFRTYLPAQADLVQHFEMAALRGQMKWKKGDPVQIGFQTELKSRVAEAGQLNLQGDAVLSEDFSTLKTLRIGGESDNLPYSLLRRSLPAELPLDPQKGTVKTNFKGEWKDAENWKLHGFLTLDNIAPTGKFKSLAKQARVSAHVKLDPDHLMMENLEVSGSQRLVSISGSISRPFSDNRVFDVKGEVTLEPQWLKSFGIELPKPLVVKGAVPVTGRIRGQISDLWVDLTGDVTAAAVEWSPYFEKASGKKGSLTLSGKVPWTKPGEATSHATFRMGMSGARFRVENQGPWFAGLGVLFTSEVAFNENRADFKDTSLTLRREADGGNIATAKADLLNIGRDAGKISGSANVIFDRTIMALAGLEKVSGLSIAGSSAVKAKFNGSPSALNWSLEAPLTNLDVTLDQTFRKPGGVVGSLTAEGKLDKDQLMLSRAKLTLPGVVLTGMGKLRDQDGKFKGLTLELKGSELRDISKLLPSSAGLGLSGPLDATVRIKAADNGVVPSGTFNLQGVDYHPKDADWRLDKIKGTVVTEGTSVEIPELAGKIVGSLEAPLKLRGSLTDVTSAETLNGRVSIETGRGLIKADRLRKLLSQAQLLVGTLLNPREDRKKIDLLEFQSLTGNVQIKTGVAHTDNIKLKGSDLNLAAMGTLRLNTMDLDLLTGIKTYAIPTAALAKLPLVKDLMKKHEDLLKITGLDKELKRLGIDANDAKEPETADSTSPKNPVIFLARVRGPAGSPQVSPVLETSLNAGVASRLKDLLN